MHLATTHSSLKQSLRSRARNAEHEQHFYLRMLQQHFRPGMRWLDAGCGHSLIPRWLRDSERIEQEFLDSAGLIVGADVDMPSLAAHSRIQRIACPLENLAFSKDTFDFITCNMVAEHLPEPSKVFAEFLRVLRPQGVVILLTPNLHHWANIVSLLTPLWFHREVSKRLWSQQPEDVFPTLYRCNTRSKMLRLLRDAGFSGPLVHMIPGRQRLIDCGPLFYPEYAWRQLSLWLEDLREVLCAVAWKPRSTKSRNSRAAIDLTEHELAASEVNA